MSVLRSTIFQLTPDIRCLHRGSVQVRCILARLHTEVVSSILPGPSAPGGIAIEEFCGLKGHSCTWSTNVAAGASLPTRFLGMALIEMGQSVGQLLEVELTDSTGSDVFTSPFDIMPSGLSPNCPLVGIYLT